MVFRFASAADKPFLSALWQEAFHDTAETAEQFFKYAFVPENTLLAELNGEKAAALYLLDTVLQAGKRTYAFSYVYAAATVGAYRKRGVMSALLRTAGELAKKRQKDALYLVPASPQLWQYYGDRGYQPAFSASLVQMDSAAIKSLTAGTDFAPAAALPPDADTFAGVRESALQNVPHIVFSKPILELSLAFSKSFDSKIFLSDQGFFTYTQEETGIFVQEFCTAAPDCTALLKVLPQHTPRLTLCMPCGTAPVQNAVRKDMGMFYPLSARINKDDFTAAYLGITLG